MRFDTETRGCLLHRRDSEVHHHGFRRRLPLATPPTFSRTGGRSGVVGQNLPEVLRCGVGVIAAQGVDLRVSYRGGVVVVRFRGDGLLRTLR